MSEPTFIVLGSDLHGSITETQTGELLLSIFHEPTGQTLYGTERTMEDARGWFKGAKLIFAEVGGEA